MDLPELNKVTNVLVFQDFLTKWPLVFPISGQKTERIVQILVDQMVPFLVYLKPYSLIEVPTFISLDEGCVQSVKG